MINLLPDDRKRDIRAARTNVMLLQYNLMMACTVVATAAVCLGFYAFLNNNEQTALATAASNQQKTAALDSTRTAADEYRRNLSTAKQIIANGVSYTNVIFAITKLLPDGVVLDNLNLSVNNFGQQTDFSAHVVSYAVAEDLKRNFQNSKTFTNVYFKTLGYESSTVGGEEKKPSKYPIAVSMSVKLNSLGTFYAK